MILAGFESAILVVAAEHALDRAAFMMSVTVIYTVFTPKE
jgi:hypothetical protein